MAMIKDKPSTNLMENNELALELYEAYERLSENKDFQTLIDKGFMDMFAKNQIGLMGHPGTIQTMKDGSRDRLIDNITAVSVFENWLITIELLGERAKKAKEEGEYADMTGEDIQSLEDEAGF